MSSSAVATGSPSNGPRIGTAMLGYVAARLGMVATAVLFIITVLFVLPHLAPGDPINYRFRTGGAAMTADLYQELEQRFGLDKPLAEQYVVYLGNLLQGDLGDSFVYGEPVLDILVSRLPATLILMLSSIFIGMVLGTFLGVLSARDPNSRKDNAVRLIALVGYSVPQFWLAVLLLQVFSLQLGLLPSGGMGDPRIAPGTVDHYISIGWHAVLPILALSLFYVALFARYSRTSMLEQATENYVLTARAKGLSQGQAFKWHVLRNGLMPLVTMVGISFAYLFGGAVLIETVFSWPGIGWLMYDAVLARDYPVIQGIFLFAAMGVITINFLIDIVYAWLDPRVRAGR